MTVTYYNSNSNRENLVLVETHKRRVSIMSVINETDPHRGKWNLKLRKLHLAAKSKVEDFEHEGDLIKLRHLKKSPNWNVMECLYMSPYREQLYFL